MEMNGNEMEMKEELEPCTEEDSDSYDCPIHGPVGDGGDCPRC